MIFGRNRNVKTETVVLPEDLQDPKDQQSTAAPDGEPVAEGASDADRRGPFDITQRPEVEGYLDLGSLRVPVAPDLKVRLDVEDSTKRIIGVTLQMGTSSLQAQAFAAPRSGGIWDEIRAEILESLAATAGAEVQEQDGEFGTEVRARIPAQMPDGSPGWRVARFVGVDGPRWFLRGVVGGEAAFKPEAAGPLDDIFSRIVVRRGENPHPPRDLLALTPPENMRPVRRGTPDGQPAPAAQDPREQRPPERGPEITEVR
jgi:hypothetical protein